jgi:hypothetical protein
MLQETVAVMRQRYAQLQERVTDGRTLEFDKDDKEAMDFVLCASNLRSYSYGIELQVR